jgi:hypothetical protein
VSFEGDCGTCGCSEDSGISGALFSSKVEAVRISIWVLLTLSSTAKTRDEKTLIVGFFYLAWYHMLRNLIGSLQLLQTGMINSRINIVSLPLYMSWLCFTCLIIDCRWVQSSFGHSAGGSKTSKYTVSSISPPLLFLFPWLVCSWSLVFSFANSALFKFLVEIIL